MKFFIVFLMDGAQVDGLSSDTKTDIIRRMAGLPGSSIQVIGPIEDGLECGVWTDSDFNVVPIVS